MALPVGCDSKNSVVKCEDYIMVCECHTVTKDVTDMHPVVPYNPICNSNEQEITSPAASDALQLLNTAGSGDEF